MLVDLLYLHIHSGFLFIVNLERKKQTRIEKKKLCLGARNLHSHKIKSPVPSDFQLFSTLKIYPWTQCKDCSHMKFNNSIQVSSWYVKYVKNKYVQHVQSGWISLKTVYNNFTNINSFQPSSEILKNQQTQCLRIFPCPDTVDA